MVKTLPCSPFCENAGCKALLLAIFSLSAYNRLEVISMNKVSTTIKKLRVEKNMNQEQLAEQLHVTRQAVSNWETGKTQPDIETLTQLAQLFGVSTEYLIYGQEPVKDSDAIKRTWRFGRVHLAITYHPEKLVLWGAVLATVVSYVKWKSIGWAMLHGLLNWGYIIYYIIRY